MVSSSTSSLDELASTVSTLIDGVNTFYLSFAAILVFIMQAGFMCLEVGCVSVRNSKNVVLKNVTDACIAATVWWLIGYGFAFGEDKGHFIGKTKFAFSGGSFTTGYSYAAWFFQWAFSAATVTIVSGSVAERINFNAYFMYAIALVGFIYPVVVHSVWSTGGWASSFAANESDLLFDCGAIDFAGSGVVHTVGGVAALMACIVVGPRIGRFAEDGTPQPMPQQSAVYQAIGVFLLWFGWYGFNGGSTLYITSAANQFTTARVIVNSTIAAGAGGLTSMFFGKLTRKIWDPACMNNGVLGGLVGITAPCSTVTPAGAFAIGVIAAFFYHFGAWATLKARVDDVVEAVPVHLFCGVWGVLAPGFFTSKTGYDNSYYAEYADGSSRTDHCAGVFYGGPGYLLAAQICYILFILGWVGVTTLTLYLILDKTVGMRVSKEMEETGLDDSKHGGQTNPEYRIHYVKPGSYVAPGKTVDEAKAPEVLA